MLNRRDISMYSVTLLSFNLQRRRISSPRRSESTQLARCQSSAQPVLLDSRVVLVFSICSNPIPLREALAYAHHIHLPVPRRLLPRRGSSTPCGLSQFRATRVRARGLETSQADPGHGSEHALDLASVSQARLRRPGQSPAHAHAPFHLHGDQLHVLGSEHVRPQGEDQGDEEGGERRAERVHVRSVEPHISRSADGELHTALAARALRRFLDLHHLAVRLGARAAEAARGEDLPDVDQRAHGGKSLAGHRLADTIHVHLQAGQGVRDEAALRIRAHIAHDRVLPPRGAEGDDGGGIQAAPAQRHDVRAELAFAAGSRGQGAAAAAALLHGTLSSAADGDLLRIRAPGQLRGDFAGAEPAGRPADHDRHVALLCGEHRQAQEPAGALAGRAAAHLQLAPAIHAAVAAGQGPARALQLLATPAHASQGGDPGLALARHREPRPRRLPLPFLVPARLPAPLGLHDARGGLYQRDRGLGAEHA